MLLPASFPLIPLFLTFDVCRRNAEMEREIAELRRRLANGDPPQAVEANGSDELSQCSEDVFCPPDAAVANRARPLSAPLEPQPMATPLTMHRDVSILSQEDNPWRLEDVSLSRTRVARLFEQYLACPTLYAAVANGWSGSSSTIIRSSLC